MKIITKRSRLCPFLNSHVIRREEKLKEKFSNRRRVIIIIIIINNDNMKMEKRKKEKKLFPTPPFPGSSKINFFKLINELVRLFVTSSIIVIDPVGGDDDDDMDFGYFSLSHTHKSNDN